MTIKRIIYTVTGILLVSSKASKVVAQKKQNALPDAINQYLEKLKKMGYNTSYNTKCQEPIEGLVTLAGEDHKHIKYPPVMPNTGAVLRENSPGIDICSEYPMVNLCVPRIDINYKDEEIVIQLLHNSISDQIDILCFLDPKIKSSLKSFTETDSTTIDHNGDVNINNDEHIMNKVFFAVQYFGIKDKTYTNIDDVLSEEILQKTWLYGKQASKFEPNSLTRLTQKWHKTERLLNQILNVGIPDRDEEMTDQILSGLGKVPEKKRNALAIVGNNHISGIKKNIEKKGENLCLITARL